MGSLLCGADWKENPETTAEAMKKSIPESKAKLVCLFWEKKKQEFLRYIKNVNLPLKNNFKFAVLLTKTSFSFTLETVLKNGEGNKLRKRRKYMRKSKLSSKWWRKLKLICIDYPAGTKTSQKRRRNVLFLVSKKS